MGIQINVSNADFSSNFSGFVPPIVDSLEAWHFLGGTLAKSAKNYAPGKQDAGIVGAPVVNTRSLTLQSRTNYLQTNVAMVAAMTLFVVGAFVDEVTTTANLGVFFSNYNGARASDTTKTSNGMGLVQAGPTLAAGGLGSSYSQIAADGSSSAIGPSTTGVNMANKAAWCFRKNVNERRLQNLTGVTSAIVNGTLADDISTTTLRIGSSYQLYSGHSDIAFFAAYSRALSDTEIAQVYARIQAIYAKWNLVI